MSKNNSPAITMMTQFVTANGRVYADYLDYKDRKDAQTNADYRSIDDGIHNVKPKSFTGYINYVGGAHANKSDPVGEDMTNLFDAYRDEISQKQKKFYKAKYAEAQNNNGLLWEGIFSFDNKVLEEKGLYDPKTHYLDERKIKSYTRDAVKKLLVAEKMDTSALWTAAIHYNTDNIHIHVSWVEPEPTRDRGKLKLSSVKRAKATMINHVVGQTPEQILINTIIRDHMIDGLKQRDLLSLSPDYEERYLKIYNSLPEDSRLWKYNNTVMASVRPEIDQFITHYLKDYHASDYNDLQQALHKQDQHFRSLYGQSAGRNYSESKMEDLYARLGNTILKHMQTYRRFERDSVTNIALKGSPAGPSFRSSTVFEKRYKQISPGTIGGSTYHDTPSAGPANSSNASEPGDHSRQNTSISNPFQNNNKFYNYKNRTSQRLLSRSMMHLKMALESEYHQYENEMAYQRLQYEIEH